MKRKSQHKRRKVGKRPRPIGRAGKRRIVPRTAEEFFAKSERFRDRWNRLTHVVSKMRAEGASLKKASKEFELDPRTVVRGGGSALRKRGNGRYAAKARDRLLRVLVAPTSDGIREIATRDSRQASRLGEYWAAIHKYLETGDASGLRQFENKYITDLNGERTPFITDLRELDRLGNAGQVSFESLYARVG